MGRSHAPQSWPRSSFPATQRPLIFLELPNTRSVFCRPYLSGQPEHGPVSRRAQSAQVQKQGPRRGRSPAPAEAPPTRFPCRGPPSRGSVATSGIGPDARAWRAVMTRSQTPPLAGGGLVPLPAHDVSLPVAGRRDPVLRARYVRYRLSLAIGFQLLSHRVRSRSESIKPPRATSSSSARFRPLVSQHLLRSVTQM